MPLLDKVTKGGILRLDICSKGKLLLLNRLMGCMDISKNMRVGWLGGTRGSVMSRWGRRCYKLDYLIVTR